jgi:hypothetical protein
MPTAQTKVKKESEIQSEIIEDLQLWGWSPVIKIIAANKAGYEVIAFRKKRAVFIEVKVPGRKLKRLQEFRKQQVLYQEFEHVTAWDRSDVASLK